MNSPTAAATSNNTSPAMAADRASRQMETPAARATISSLCDARAPSPSRLPSSADTGIMSNMFSGSDSNT